MPTPLKVVAVHGIGHQTTQAANWQPEWQAAIEQEVRQTSSGRKAFVQFAQLDAIFEKHGLGAEEWLEAVGRLGLSLMQHGISDLLSRTRQRRTGLSHFIRWYIGMVAQWASQEKLRDELRSAVAAEIEAFGCDLLIGHSLGSLICYDLLLDPEHADLGKRLSLMSLGSQIGNPAVRNTFGGRLVMPPVRHWFHLYNPRDRVLTAEVRINHDAYTQLITEFGSDELKARFGHEGDWINHDAVGYLTDPETRIAWETVTDLRSRRGKKSAHAAMALTTVPGFFVPKSRQTPQNRALIVGINEYADPADRLEGCVNDAFLMSSLLQSSGFAAEDIRLVLDSRATADAIRERLEWLVDGVRDGDVRFFHYSGHGARIPTYGIGEVVDSLDECLVPHDFDGSRETAIVDDWFYELYSQLPYGCRFVAVFDCCHAGGISRGVKVRGLNLPDDIRHRALRWDDESGLWVPRELEPLPGTGPARYPLGNANCVRGEDCYSGNPKYYALRERFGHLGPYKPVIFKACQESELAEEYRHGNHSYGAFTFALVETLRRARREAESISCQRLAEEVAGVLQDRLRVQQTPEVEGPQEILEKPIPLKLTTSSKRRRSRKGRPSRRKSTAK